MERETRQCEEFQVIAALRQRPAGAYGTLLFLALVFFSSLFSGCATTKLPNIDEYRGLTKEGRAGVQAALRSLDEIAAHPGNVSSKQLTSYERDVQSLQVNSVRIRARIHAIEARGDQYFASWSETLANVKDPHVREAASRSRPELEAAFGRLKTASQGAGAAFKPFSAGLQKLRVELEIRPAGVDSADDRELIRKTSEKGREVLQQLQTIDGELATMRKTLTSK